MPYINKDARLELDALLGPLLNHISRYPKIGELNYVITKLALCYNEVWSRGYADFNDIIGALECAKMEYYRRVVLPYEEEKRKINGDVYPPVRGVSSKTTNKDEEL